MDQRSKDIHAALIVAMAGRMLDGDRDKAVVWMKTRHPELEDNTPLEMIALERVGEVYDFVERVIREKRK